jgi:lipopolysaccharide transport system ATP-binding protein
MNDIAIVVESLSKRYLVGHRSGRQYTALRDLISREARTFARKAADFVRGRQIIQGDEVEEFWALKNVSFEVKRGEVVGIIGRNGAGKSTLLKILSRITEPTEGRVLLRGRVASLLEVGTGFHGELTGRENIFLNGAILGMTRHEIRQRFDEIVAFAEIEKFLDTPVKHYSSGMYVRLAFAVAAHLQSEILIVDEVLAVGDFEFQKKCLGKMEGVVREGRTILFVSHQISAINQLCQRVVWLDQGRVVTSGATSAIVAGYLGGHLGASPSISLRRRRPSGALAFSELSIRDHGHNLSSQIDVRFPFSIRLCYEVSQEVKSVEITVRIKTLDGVAVFTSAYSDCSDLSKMDKQSGFYAATIQVPALFLMPGSYTISARAYRFVGGHVEPLHIADDVLRFQVCETGTKVEKYGDQHRRFGVVLVNLPWREERLLNPHENIVSYGREPGDQSALPKR